MHFHKIHLPPIFLPTIALITGIGCYALHINFYVQYLCVSLVATTYFVIAKNKKMSSDRLLLIGFVVLCFIWGSLTPALKTQKHQAFIASVVDNMITVTGTIQDQEIYQESENQVKVENAELGDEKTEENKSYVGHSAQMLIMRPQTVTVGERPVECRKSGAIKIYLRQTVDCAIGDTVCCEKIFWRSPKPDQSEWPLLRAGLAGTFSANRDSITILKKSTGLLSFFKNFFFKKRTCFLAELRKKMSGESFNLFNTLFLGRSTKQCKNMENTKKDFTAWGIAHYLARSGLHVTAILMLWRLLFQLLPLGLFLRQLLLMIGLGCFWLLSWPSVSFLRAVFAYFIAQTTIAAQIQPHPFHIVTLVCFLVLAHNPFHLFFLNFQLSFLLAFILVFFYEIVATDKRNVPEKK